MHKLRVKRNPNPYEKDWQARDQMLHEMSVAKYMRTHEPADAISDEERKRLIADFYASQLSVSEFLTKHLDDGRTPAKSARVTWARTAAVEGEIPDECIPY
jgi:hypothetical protein